jgi:hypothetical protein
MSFKSHAVLISLAAAFALLLTSTVNAATLRVSGSWLDNRGQITIPVVGATVTGTGLINVTNPDTSGPATMTANAGRIWGFDLQTANIPLPGPNNVQLFTQLSGEGPVVPLETSMVTTPSAWVGKLAPSLSPSRAFASFAFCPGATANPACATNKWSGTAAVGASQGTRHGLISYSPSTPQFGGTMRNLLSGFVSITINVGATPKFSHQPIGGGGASQAQYTGGHYNATGTNYFGAGVVTTGAATTTFGAISVPGTTLPAPSGTGLARTNLINAFPFTVGTIIGLDTDSVINTFSVMGYDTRTVNGRGNIQLVAGALGQTINGGFGQATASYNVLTLDVSSGQLTPAMSPTGMVALGSLLLLGGGYVLRKRFV